MEHHKLGANKQTLKIIRFLDFIFSLISLFIFLPLLILIAVTLFFSGEGEVFYRQIRIGINGREFRLIKFATMLKSSPTIDTGELTLPNDPRVLTVGRFLRKTKLNELPQLWNILIGDLSFIGPRPQTKKYFSRFDEVDRLWVSKVRPGLSGVGSILFHDEETIISKVKDPQDFDDNVITPYKGHVERWFVLNQSLSLYFELIFTTVAVIFFPSAGFRQKLLVRLPSPPPEIYKLLI